MKWMIESYWQKQMTYVVQTVLLTVLLAYSQHQKELPAMFQQTTAVQYTWPSVPPITNSYLISYFFVIIFFIKFLSNLTEREWEWSTSGTFSWIQFFSPTSFNPHDQLQLLYVCTCFRMASRASVAFLSSSPNSLCWSSIFCSLLRNFFSSSETTEQQRTDYRKTTIEWHSLKSLAASQMAH